MSSASRWRDSGHLERAVATAGGQEAFDAAVSAMLDDARGWRLAELRKRRGMTQEATRMGVSVARVSQIERGDVSTQDVLNRFVAALGGTLKLIADFGDEQLKIARAQAGRPCVRLAADGTPPGAASAMFGLAAHVDHLSWASLGKIVRLPAGTVRSVELNTVFRGVEMVAIRQAALSVFALTAAASGLASTFVVPAAAADRPASTASKLRSGSVTIIDTRTNAVTATVRVGMLPVQLVITPNGKTAYVLNLFSGTVTRLATGSGVTTRTVRSAAFPLGLAITPGGRTLYISRSSRTSPGSVLPVDARTGVPGRPVRLPASARAGKLAGPIAVVPDGSKVLAAEYLAGNRSREGVQPIETAGHRLGRLVQFGRDGYQPDTILVTPDSRTAFVLGHYGNGDRASLLTQVSMAKGEVRRSLALPFAQMAAAMTPDGRLIYLTDSYDNRVTVVRTATDSILDRIPVNSASSLAVSPDGKTVFVGGTDRSTGAPEIVTISTAGNKPSAPILLGDGYGTVNAIAFTPSGRTAYAAIGGAGGHFVVPVNTATRAPGPFITVGPNPAAIAIARHGSTMYVLNSNYCC